VHARDYNARSRPLKTQAEGKRKKGKGRREKGEGRREKKKSLLPSALNLTLA
jgi:hypothetical protein